MKHTITLLTVLLLAPLAGASKNDEQAERAVRLEREVGERIVSA